MFTEVIVKINQGVRFFGPPCIHVTNFTSSNLISTDLISSELSACEVNQFAVVATTTNNNCHASGLGSNVNMANHQHTQYKDYTLLDHQRRTFGGLYCYAKFGGNPCSSLHDMNV